MRMIDADGVWDSIRCDVAPFNVAMISRHIHNAPTIDPETLPIVQQLREENARLNRGIFNLAENVKSVYEQRDKIHDELEKITAERDALKTRFCEPEPCITCKHYDNPNCGGNGDCLLCKCKCVCKQCNKYSNWTWRGKQKEE